MRADQLQEIQAPQAMVARWPRDLPLPKVYRMGTCGIFVGREPVDVARQELRWHLSISHPVRLPAWGEIRAARDALLPADVVMAIPYPPRAWWLSLHPNCLHLWEVRDHELTELWRQEGERAQRLGYGTPTPGQHTRPPRRP